MRNTILLPLVTVLAGAVFAPTAQAQRYYDHRDGGYYDQGGIECRGGNLLVRESSYERRSP